MAAKKSGGQAVLYLITIVVSIIFCFIMYHRIFDVVYFGSKGCIQEIVGCFVGGYLLATLISQNTAIQIIGIIVMVIIIFGAGKKS